MTRAPLLLDPVGFLVGQSVMADVLHASSAGLLGGLLPTRTALFFLAGGLTVELLLFLRHEFTAQLQALVRGLGAGAVACPLLLVGQAQLAFPLRSILFVEILTASVALLVVEHRRPRI